MAEIKAIETSYKGYRFRSRLEARWACFFDALKIPWEYEKEGYDLSGVEWGDIQRFKLPQKTWYLPDFWLPTVGLRTTNETGIWVEIKPEYSDDAAIKCAGLSTISGFGAILAVGLPRLSYDREPCLYEVSANRWDVPMCWMKCSACGAVKIEYPEGNYSYCEKCKTATFPEEEWPGYIAFDAARRARFEFGESGAPR